MAMATAFQKPALLSSWINIVCAIFSSIGAFIFGFDTGTLVSLPRLQYDEPMILLLFTSKQHVLSSTFAYHA